MTIEPAGTRVSKWGEGPLWHQGQLWYVDINGHEICRFDPSSGQEDSWNVLQRVGFVVPCNSGRLIYGGDNGLYFFDPKTGASTLIHDPEPGIPDNRFNDGKCSPDGRLFAGTISLKKITGTAKLYRLDPNLSCHEAYGPVTNSNGIVWSLDGKTCYYIDTPTKSVKAFAYDSATGKLTDERKAVDTSSRSSSPDGMAIDSEGHLWIAFCHGACVVQFDPLSGKELRSIELPCLETTACAFAGGDLYVTTGIHATEKEALAGRLLVIRGLGATGPVGNVFAD